MSCGNSTSGSSSDDSRELIPEPDKDLRLKAEMNVRLNEIEKYVMDTKNIASSSMGMEVIDMGEDALWTLIDFFNDTTELKMYSSCQRRMITKGELAIILADRIKGMPYALLTNIQNCTMELCDNNDNGIEYYLWAIKEMEVGEFRKRYIEWLVDSKS